jgi:hypothetical protein
MTCSGNKDGHEATKDTHEDSPGISEQEAPGVDAPGIDGHEANKDDAHGEKAPGATGNEDVPEVSPGISEQEAPGVDDYETRKVRRLPALAKVAMMTTMGPRSVPALVSKRFPG